jgi:hypothetical protein
MGPKVKTSEEGIEACSLTRNISGVERRDGVAGSGLRRLISKSIIHMDLHKPNNKLINT